MFGPRTPQREGGLEDFVDECRANDSFVVCHASILADPLGRGDTVCAGFYTDVYQDEGVGQLLRIAERLGSIDLVEDDFGDGERLGPPAFDEDS